MSASIHKTVLLNETIEGLNLGEKPEVIDCTFGGGGHSAEICRRYPGAKIVAIDEDKNSYENAKSKFHGLDCEINFINMNFAEFLSGPRPRLGVGITLARGEASGKVDGIIFDLGLSSDQLENSGRGFSFLRDEPLEMTMKAEPGEADLKAKDIVNDWAEESLADIIYGYGEERYARRIAKAIVEARAKQRIATTGELVRIIERAVPVSYRRGRIHFATKTFQALRIATNDELGNLNKGLRRGFEILKTNGRMAVITFHSLEDRIVKKFFMELKASGSGKWINKKPITAGPAEIKVNPRARSAKLRIIEKV